MEAERPSETSQACSLYRNRYRGFFTTEMLTQDQIYLPQIVCDCIACPEVPLILQCQRPTAECPQKPAVDHTKVQLKPLKATLAPNYYSHLKLDFNFPPRLMC
jgi:hypothetical protein